MVDISTHLYNSAGKVARQHFVQRDGFLYQQFHVLVRSWLGWRRIPSDRIEALDMHRETVTHDCYQFRVDLILMLLVVALEFIKLNENDGLLRG